MITISTVAPVVNPWLTSAVTVPSTRLVARVNCASSEGAVVQVSLYGSDNVRILTSSDVTCDGHDRTRDFAVTKGGVYFVGFSVSAGSVPTTAALLAG